MPPIAAAPEIRRAMLDVEVFGAELAPGAPPPQEVRRLCALATAAVGIAPTRAKGGNSKSAAASITSKPVTSEKIAPRRITTNGRLGPR